MPVRLLSLFIIIENLHTPDDVDFCLVGFFSIHHRNISMKTISSITMEKPVQTNHSPGHFNRKLLQTNSSSFNTSQPSFIVLLVIIIILTIAFVTTVIILCCRVYLHRERKLKHRRKRRPDLPTRNHQPIPDPTSITPTPASSYSGRSSEQLLSDQRGQNGSINTLPSRRLQQSLLDAYLNDLNSGQPATIDPKQLNSYLFIDLHSTSSETFAHNTRLSSHHTSTDNHSQRPHRYQRRHRSTTAHQPRFLMRERSLPNNLQTLPQLRQMTNQHQRRLFGHDDTNNSTITITNADLQSTTISTTTEEYDESHAYNVKQNQMLQTINEERPFTIERYFPSMPYPSEHEPHHLFEMVSTSRDDSSDIRIPYRSSPIPTNRITYMNDSIIV